MDSDEEFDAVIYVILETKTGKVVYVGKAVTSTDGERDGGRFVEHARNDEGMPWHISVVSYGDDPNSWPYSPSNIWNLKGVTRLEIAAAEQWAYENYGGLEGKLKNKIRPLTATKFLQYKNAKTFRPGKMSMAASWCPK